MAPLLSVAMKPLCVLFVDLDSVFHNVAGGKLVVLYELVVLGYVKQTKKQRNKESRKQTNKQTNK